MLQRLPYAERHGAASGETSVVAIVRVDLETGRGCSSSREPRMTHFSRLRGCCNRAGVMKSVASDTRLPKLRVVVKTGSQPPNPYSWVLVDDVSGREVHRSPRRFRTLSLAWDNGVSALARLPRAPDDNDREQVGS